MYTNYFSRILVFVFILNTLFVILFSVPKALAQSANTGLNLTISPTLLELTARPGDTLKEKFRIRNSSSTPVTLNVIVDKLDPLARNGQVVPVKPDQNDTSVGWISFDTASISALPKEWTDVNFTISVPTTAAFGYYYAFRIGPSAPSGQTTGATTQLLGQIVLPVLLTVPSPNAKAELTLVGFAPVNFFNEYLPVTFNATFRNTGNVAIKPNGTIFVRLSDGESTALDLNPGSGIILPGGQRSFRVDWADGFLVQTPVMQDGQVVLDNNNKPEYHVSVNWNNLTHFRIGKYTATLLAVYDNGQKDVPLETTTTFWVFPYTLCAVLLIGLCVLFVVGRFFLKWYVAKEIRKQRSS